ncbi:MAG TPA: NADH-quinone oxidoreductase subunit NuoE [Candidatus Hydrothermia bacterium]|nr:NADH-quinone oxidoreductase subunit NuoE [Candidatus Hydrothermae bacterium]MDD3648576.1 NADH-quinone oxidoreductase subunit NuoE [Candidatus Hydrothermia bacterium]MDD5572682.1 NADH-quinone oxidoreductase subunit NuoE [Candidatus Hydrothermia bacterium]HOK22564.1 NADH-quinone oxidoreductase subunit NuoE [Candidatus Hydrothermia bacterium]HOL23271.1 NADH-quinone oxidoreductase subunit NuoE [Candidatus Hydrothermia bacterium]
MKLEIPVDSPQYQVLKRDIARFKRKSGSLIQVLHRAQEIFGYLPAEVQYFVAHELDVPVSQVYGVVTFYNFFRMEPVAKHVINVCMGTACHVKGAEGIVKAVSEELGIKVGETTKDKFFTLSTARCFGACGLAPVIMINEDVYGKLTPEKVKEVIREYRLEKEKEERGGAN